MNDINSANPSPKTRWLSSSRDGRYFFAALWANLAVFILLKDPDPVTLLLSLFISGGWLWASWEQPPITDHRERRLFWLAAGLLLLVGNYIAWQWL